jgi:predicted RNA binding protein YcfA (HicA-like mRNA interferase family)
VNLPLLSGRQVLAALTRLGFQEVGRKGGHVKLIHPDGRRIVFPFHNEIDRYTLRGALRDAEIDTAEFLPEVRS